MKVTWVLVARGDHAKLISVTRNGKEIERVTEFNHPQTAMKDLEIHTDRQGRNFESASDARHAMDYGEEPKDHERSVFAKEIADYIATQHATHNFDSLLVVASPKLLGALRQSLPQRVQQIISHELAKDLSSLDLKDDELVKRIQDDLQLLRL